MNRQVTTRHAVFLAPTLSDFCCYSERTAAVKPSCVVITAARRPQPCCSGRSTRTTKIAYASDISVSEVTLECRQAAHIFRTMNPCATFVWLGSVSMAAQDAVFDCQPALTPNTRQHCFSSFLLSQDLQIDLQSCLLQQICSLLCQDLRVTQQCRMQPVTATALSAPEFAALRLRV